MSQLEQWTNIKFCQKLGKTAAKTFQMMQQVYGGDTLSRSVVITWHQHFSQRRDSLEDDVHTGRPEMVQTECKIEEVAKFVHVNCSQSVDDLAAAVGVSHGTYYKIVTDDIDSGGPVVIRLTTGSEIRGFKPGRGQWIFESVKILSMTSFRREVKQWDPCSRFTAHKRTSIRN